MTNTTTDKYEEKLAASEAIKRAMHIPENNVDIGKAWNEARDDFFARTNTPRSDFIEIAGRFYRLSHINYFMYSKKHNELRFTLIGDGEDQEVSYTPDDDLSSDDILKTYQSMLKHFNCVDLGLPVTSYESGYESGEVQKPELGEDQPSVIDPEPEKLRTRLESLIIRRERIMDASLHWMDEYMASQSKEYREQLEKDILVAKSFIDELDVLIRQEQSK